MYEKEITFYAKKLEELAYCKDDYNPDDFLFHVFICSELAMCDPGRKSHDDHWKGAVFLTWERHHDH